MKIGFATFSLPFKWWNNTNIAHNKIWSYMVLEISKNRPNTKMYVLNNIDYKTYTSFINAGGSKYASNILVDVLIVFCGPYMPLQATPTNLTWQTLNLIKKHKGKVVYITCDYLLQFPFQTSRYGTLLKNWDTNAFTKDKEWTYLLHGGFDHHFKTNHQKQKVLNYVKRSNFIEIPLNMAGIPPTHAGIKYNTNPKIDLLYCGAFRKGRKDSFIKYFCNKYAKTWIISTSRQNKFKELPEFSASLMQPLQGKIYRFINNSYVQLIMGDKTDSKCSTTPLPTRFWEAIGTKTPVVLDSQTCNWDAANGMILVNNAAELHALIEKFKQDPSYRRSFIKNMTSRINLDNLSLYKEWKMNEWL